MYNVQINENGFYMGSYATVGTVKDGVDVTKLPPFENSLCYKLVDVEVFEEKQVPVLEYTKIVESETEFDIFYSITTLDEEENEISTFITEEEYNTLSGEEKENVEIIQVPKMTVITLSKNEYDTLSDEEKEGFIAAYKEDELGELVFETIQVPKIVKDWEFSQEKYDELEAAKIKAEEKAMADAEYKESISNEALKEENQMLREEVETLTMCLLEMSEIVYA